MVSSRLGDWLVRRAQRPVPVVRARMGRQRLVYLLGPDANAMVFANDERFRVREAFAALEVVDGPTSVVLSDGADHARRRGMIRPALAPRRIDGYLGAMTSSADEALDRVDRGAPFDASALFRRAIRRSTLRALFGEGLAEHADALGEMLQPLIDLSDSVQPVLAARRRLNTPAWRRAMRARTALDAFIADQVADERRRGPDAVGDSGRGVLSLLVHGRDGHGSGLSDLEIRDQAVTLIAAGYETTSAAMGWIVYLLGAHPDWQRRARAEVAAVLDDRAPGPADLEQLTLVRAVVDETLRMYPPAMISARYVVTGFDFAGRPVRPGDLVLFSPYATHRDPRVYDDPLAFRPDRWLDAERRPPHEYLPWGGGRHRCLGSGMATAELVVMLARLLGRGLYELRGAPRTTRSLAAMRPHPGVRIAFTDESRPRGLSASGSVGGAP